MLRTILKQVKRTLNMEQLQSTMKRLLKEQLSQKTSQFQKVGLKEGSTMQHLKSLKNERN